MGFHSHYINTTWREHDVHLAQSNSLCMLKNILLFTTFLSSCYTLIGQLTYSSGEHLHFWGPVTIYELENTSYTPWFTTGVEDYKPQIHDLAYYHNLKDVQVSIFIGTWCGDTKRNLPQFIKTWETLDLPESNLEIIALHNEMEYYKQGPNREELNYDIHRVPTFIFLKEGIEIGRIVESPHTDFETELAQISLGIPTKPAYACVDHLQKLLRNHSIDTLRKNIDEISSTIGRMEIKVSGLTTYAKKLEADGKLREAELVLDVAMRIFPYYPGIYYASGMYHKNQKNYILAGEFFIKALTMDPNYEQAKRQLMALKQ